MDVLTLPFAMKSSTLVAQATAYRLLDLRKSADWLLSLSAPTNFLQHPNKIVTVTEDFGLLVDCWERKFAESTLGSVIAEGNLLRRAETVALAEARLKLCFSTWTENRLRKLKIDGFNVVKPSHLTDCMLDPMNGTPRVIAPGRLSA